MTEIILTSSVLIGFLIILRSLLRGRIHPTVQYALWLLVAARLLIPGTLFTAPVSVMGAAGDLHSTIEDTLYPEDKGSFTTPVYPMQENLPPEKVVEHGDTVITYYPPQATAPTPPATAINWVDVIWKTGMALIGSALFLSNSIFYARLRKNRQKFSPNDLPHPCRIPVYVADDLTTPCLCGIFRPAIYINRDALAPARLEHILTHEETHLRHGDHLWALLRSLCLVIHWYNPLVWWAASLSRRDCELSCDAAALRRLGADQRIAYGKTLLSMISPRNSPADLLRTATTMTAGKRTMKERIQLISKAPKMLKITLIPVVLTACVAVVLVFGGAAEDPTTPPSAPKVEETTPKAEEITPQTGSTLSESPTALTAEAAEALYREARMIWNWFELGTIPTTGAPVALKGEIYLTVQDFTSIDDLRAHLCRYFSSSLADHLLNDYAVFRENGNKLYVLPVSRTPSIYAGKETVTAFPLTGEEAARQGYDCHICSTTEVLDLYDTETVLYEKRHDWHMVWNGQNYVFTSFGPTDDVDPQKYYNVLTILQHYEDGAGIITWWPMVENLDWNAVRATQNQWPEGFDLSMYILSSLSEYVAGESSLTAAQMVHILSATEGLDGAYSEQFQFIVYELYRKAPSVFAYAVLDGSLSANDQAAILDFFRFEEPYHRAPSAETAALSREEATAMLYTVLSEGLSAAPSEMTFTEAGQKVQFLPISAYDVYAASYTSSNPSVATVDKLGFVEAVAPGTATITLRYDGAGGQRDFTCAVTCKWSEPVAGPDPLQQRDGEVMMGIARGYGPSVFGVGSPQNLELSITGDWTLTGIEAAILSAIQQHMEGTLLEGDARSVTVSYAFQFPEKMQDGVVMEVPFFIDYVDTDVFTLPSGATHSPGGRTHELTARVTLSGSGVTAPVDAEFAAGQALHQKLISCVSIAEIRVGHDLESYDLSAEIINRINSNLTETGIDADSCWVEGLSFGTYQNPVWCDPGYTQSIPCTVTFRYKSGFSYTFRTEVTVETT